MAQQRIFAENVWLGPGQFAQRVVVDFDHQVREVHRLAAHETPPEDCIRVTWLMPGFVNAHCHLEYTWLAGADLPRGSVPFGDWMRAIVGMRPQTPDAQAQRHAGLAEGARELLRGGCTTVFDSTTDGASETALAQSGIRYFLFHEVLGLSPERAAPMLELALGRLSQEDKLSDKRLGGALNPHAPYSVGGWLGKQLASPAAARFPQAWHLAESGDEDELFRSGTGSIAEFLRDFGMGMPWENGPQPAISPFQWLHEQGLLKQCPLVFHGDYLEPSEAGYFSGGRGLVHCPGTHRWFARQPAALKKWVDAGGNVCLGTDSLASCETLSMLEMVRFVLADHGDLSVDDVLTMACINPWKISLLYDTNAGAALPLNARGISVGAMADFVVLTGHSPPARKYAGPADIWRSMLLAENLEKPVVGGVWVGGEQLY